VVLLDGAAWQACLIRAAGRIETINMNIDVPDPWQSIAAHFKTAFYLGLSLASQQNFAKIPYSLSSAIAIAIEQQSELFNANISSQS
jgi:hypothetical protein